MVRLPIGAEYIVPAERSSVNRPRGTTPPSAVEESKGKQRRQVQGVEKSLQGGWGTDKQNKNNEQNKNKKTDGFILVKGKKEHTRGYAKGYVAADIDFQKNAE
jgi:hypothetical protein